MEFERPNRTCRYCQEIEKDIAEQELEKALTEFSRRLIREERIRFGDPKYGAPTNKDILF